jgi:hemolysin III
MTQRHNVQTQFGDYLERMNISDPYPDYTRGERIADGAVHAAGIVFAVVATILLIVAASGETSVGTVVALSIYGAALIGSFIASACYHFTPWDRPRALLRRIDHAAIYLKIAGTYTPLVVLIGSAFAYGVLGLVWALAAVGAIAKLFFWVRPSRWGVGLYLGLGWLSVALVSSLIPLVSGVTLGLIVAGGLVYSLGAIVFSIDGLRYQNAIWHSFVLAASVCFCLAIALGVLPAA